MELLAGYESDSSAKSHTSATSAAAPCGRKRRRFEGLPALEAELFDCNVPCAYSTVLTNGRYEQKDVNTAMPTKITGRTDGPIWVRSVPHTQGIWATHIHIRGESLHGPKGDQSESLHTELPRAASVLASPHSFSICFGEKFGLLVNDDKTRSFLTIEIDEGIGKLQRLSHAVDDVLRRYRQPIFYENPRYHISVAAIREDASKAWEAGEQSNQESQTMPLQRQKLMCEQKPSSVPKGNSAIAEAEASNEERLTLEVDEIECRIGNKIYHITLRT